MFYRHLATELDCLAPDYRVLSSIQKEFEILEMNIQPDHVHVPAMVSPKISISDIGTGHTHPLLGVNPNVAKVGELQSQGAKGEAVEIYCEPFATRDLKLSGFPEGKKMAKSAPSLNSPLVIFRKGYKKHNFPNEFNMFIILCHVFYATLGLTQ